MTRWIATLLLTGCYVTDEELRLALDRDGDGYLPVQAGGDDCDEGRADIHPGAVEVCGDGLDNNCDGVPDDDGVGARLWFADADGDGFGVDTTTMACSEPEGFAPVAGDCDDEDPAINPAIEDLCDGLDQNCNGQVDDDATFTLYFEDADLDGAGNPAVSIEACGASPGFVLTSDDCDDTDGSVRPGVVDSCNGVDQNCDGTPDNDASFDTWWEDADGDGVGSTVVSATTCDGAPVGYVPNSGDCVDSDPTVVIPNWYFDGDGDGHGAGPPVPACEAPVQHVALADDCEDSDPLRSPSTPEICMNGVDDDCSKQTRCRPELIDTGVPIWEPGFEFELERPVDLIGNADAEIIVFVLGLNETWIFDGESRDFDNPAAIFSGRIRIFPGDASGDGRPEVRTTTRLPSDVRTFAFYALEQSLTLPYLQIEGAPADTVTTAASGNWGVRGPGVWLAARDQLLFYPWSAEVVDFASTTETISMDGAEISSLTLPDGSHALAITGDGPAHYISQDSLNSSIGETIVVPDMTFEGPPDLYGFLPLPSVGFPHALALVRVTPQSILEFSVWADGNVLTGQPTVFGASGNEFLPPAPVGDLDGDSILDYIQLSAFEGSVSAVTIDGSAASASDFGRIVTAQSPSGTGFRLLRTAEGVNWNDDRYADLLVEINRGDSRALHVVLGTGE